MVVLFATRNAHGNSRFPPLYGLLISSDGSVGGRKHSTPLEGIRSPPIRCMVLIRDSLRL